MRVEWHQWASSWAARGRMLGWCKKDIRTRNLTLQREHIYIRALPQIKIQSVLRPFFLLFLSVRFVVVDSWCISTRRVLRRAGIQSGSRKFSGFMLSLPLPGNRCSPRRSPSFRVQQKIYVAKNNKKRAASSTPTPTLTPTTTPPTKGNWVDGRGSFCRETARTKVSFEWK